jgi:dolichol-phosphate mannosyltransferase
MQKKISMIVCTFNEVNHIERTLKLIDDNLKDCETIIIDDNSQDGTLNKLEKLKSKYKFKLFVRTKERGLASAQVKGFKESTGKYLGTVDANSTDQILYFNKLASKLDDGFDIAVLSRYIKGGGDERIFIRSFASKSINVVSKIFLRIPYSDFTSGIFLMKRNIFHKTEHLISGYAEWFIEFIYFLYKRNYKIIEIPYLQTKDDDLIESKSFPNIFTFFYLGLKYLLRIFITIFKN